MWAGLVVGLVEAGWWAAWRYGLGTLIWQGESYFWMGPMAQVVLGAPLVFGSALLVWYWPNSSVRHLALFGVVYWIWIGIVLVPGQSLHFVAVGLLAAGLTAGTARLIIKRLASCRTIVDCSLPCLVILIAAGGAMAELSRWERERRTRAALVPADPKAPNVLLIVLDTVRADALGIYGKRPSTSPWLDQFASRGVIFERAMATAPWTLTSHAGIFTGRLPGEISADWNSPLDGTWPTLAEWLTSQGYETAGFSANTAYATEETGLARGFTHFESRGWTPSEFALNTAIGRAILHSTLPCRLQCYGFPGRKPAEEMSAHLLEWLDGVDRRPFFAFLNLIDAHDPYLPPAPLDTRRPVTLDDRIAVRHWWQVDKPRLSARQVVGAKADYEDCLRVLDMRLGELFDALEIRDRLKNTLVIITADHGEQFGEHDLFTHGNSLYQPLLHVPLVIAGPGIPSHGLRVKADVSLRDIPRTIVDLVAGGNALPGRPSAGKQSPGPPFPGQHFPGQSLARFWEAESGTDRPPGNHQPVVAQLLSPAPQPIENARAPAAGCPLSCIVHNRMKYIASGNGREELYDLARDPEERHNLYRYKAYAGVLSELKGRLAEGTFSTREDP